MLEGPAVVRALEAAGVTHVVWIPDSHLGTWEPALRSAPGLCLVRACREGEAIALAAGLLLGGKRPVVMLQCTGLFEAGDALRNAVHDLQLPLFLIVGVRSWFAYQEGRTKDNCPVFTEPYLQAWQLPYQRLGPDATADDLADAYRQAARQQRPFAVLVPE
jgi:sulfopyruvate decarboxylase TPP-binding subunit